MFIAMNKYQHRGALRGTPGSVKEAKMRPTKVRMSTQKLNRAFLHGGDLRQVNLQVQLPAVAVAPTVALKAGRAAAAAATAAPAHCPRDCTPCARA